MDVKQPMYRTKYIRVHQKNQLIKFLCIGNVIIFFYGSSALHKGLFIMRLLHGMAPKKDKVGF